MAKVEQKIAKKYAKALFESVDPSLRDETAQALNELADTWSCNEEFRNALVNPLSSSSERLEVVREICELLRPGDLVFKNFGLLFLSNNRLGNLPDTAATFSRLVDEARGMIFLEVTSAFPLSEDDKGGIQWRLGEQLESETSINWKIDPDIIGGLIVKMGDRLLDGSVRGTLEQIRGKLLFQ